MTQGRPRDNTEEIRAASALADPASILDYSPRGIIVTDNGWRVVYANQTLLREARCSVQDLVGKHLLEAAENVGRDTSGEFLHYLRRLTEVPPQEVQVQVLVVQVPEKRFV